MAERKDTHDMTERQLLSEIYEKLEILDDIVRGDTDRDINGWQKDVAQIKKDVSTLKQASALRQGIITSIASLVAVLASVATVVSIAWQSGGG